MTFFNLKRVLFIFFCLAGYTGFSQNLELITDLKQRLDGTTGETRFNLLNQLAWEYRSAFPDSAIHYATEAQSLGQTIALPKGTAITLNYIGLSNYYKGNYIRAFDYYERALDEATVHQDSIQLAHANNNIGRLFSEQGMLTQSYPYFVKAQLLFEGLGDSSGLAYVYQSFATLFKTQKEYAKSELNFQKALQIRLASGNTRDIMSAMVQLGKLYIETKQFDDALLYFQRADSAGNVIHDAIGLAEIKILTAEYYLSKDKFTESEKLATEGITYILGSKNVKLVPRAYLVLGEIYFKMKDYAVARKYFLIALGVSTQMKYLDLKMQSHFYLWKLSEIAHNRADELLHSNEYLVLKDSINDMDLSQKIAQFQFQLEIERKQQENELLKAADAENQAVIKQQNLQRGVLGITVIFISILLYIQWRNAKKIRIINDALKTQSEEIARMNETLEQRVRERTQELENQNKQLTEYAFINSHLLRSPVSHILGLINLLEVDDNVDEERVIQYLKKSCLELDDIVKKITGALDTGEHFDRKFFKE